MSGKPQAMLGLGGFLSLVSYVPRFGKLCLFEHLLTEWVNNGCCHKCSREAPTYCREWILQWMSLVLVYYCL